MKIVEETDLDKAEVAVKTLENKGYTYHGGEQWKPPIGENPDLVDYWKNRAEIFEKALQNDCDVCANKKDCIKYPCYCINGNAWKFDEERFAKVDNE